jgi:hypothetical protein
MVQNKINLIKLSPKSYFTNLLPNLSIYSQINQALEL